MSMFSFDRPVKMRAADQGGISGGGSSTQTASLGNYLRKLDESFIKTYERKQESGIQNSDFETNKYKKLKQKYGDQFSSSIQKDTKVASLDTDDVFDRMSKAMEEKFGPVEGTVFPGVTDDDPYKFSSGHDTSDASKSEEYKPNKVEQFINAVTFTPSATAGEMPKNSSIKGVYRPSGVVTNLPSNYKESEAKAFADAKAYQESKGIRTPAAETKITETKRMAGGFFSPQNFQKSGVPDATIMTREQMGQAITGDPGYTRFGTLDRPGTQAAKDTKAFNEAYKRSFFTPDKVDARSITERREASTQSMRDEARARDTQFRETGKQTFGGKVGGERISGDDTYGTNVMSNPAFGFRSKMSAENQKKYDASATEATRRAEVEPSKGNLLQSTANFGKRIFNTAIGAEGGTPLTREVSLEKRGEAELRRYEKYLNRPTYQK